MLISNCCRLANRSLANKTKMKPNREQLRKAKCMSRRHSGAWHGMAWQVQGEVRVLKQMRICKI